LAEHLGIPHLSTGEMFRDAAQRKTEVGLLAQEYFTSGRLVPDDVVIGIVEERLAAPDCAAGCLLDGFPRTLEQAAALDKILAEKGTPIDAVLELTVSDEELMKRMLARGRVDDTREAIAKRMEEYAALTRPLTAYFRDRGLVTEIEGEGTMEDVFDRVIASTAARSEGTP
jgi:adenylate kinase